MNVREGTRRLAVVFGVIGCAVGCYASYADAKNLWKVKRFESLMVLPIAQEIEKLAKEFQATTRPGVSTFDLETLRKLPPGRKDALTSSLSEQIPLPPPGFTLDADGPTEPLVKGRLSAITRTNAEITKELGRRDLDPPVFVPERDSAKAQGRGLLTVIANRDGVRSITTDSNGDIREFRLLTGESASRPDTRLLMSLLLVALYPVAGFVLPWGVLRSLSWVAAGFLAPLPK